METCLEELKREKFGNLFVSSFDGKGSIHLAWVCGELIRLGLEIVVTDKRL
jgi:hypothetical protein